MAKKQYRPEGKHSHQPRKEKPRTLPTIRFAFSRLDIGGRWSFRALRHDDVLLLCAKLPVLATFTWQQLVEQGSHRVETARLTRAANERLRDLGLDDFDELYSLRLEGGPRIWGPVVEGVLEMVWWDPLHEICPTLPR